MSPVGFSPADSEIWEKSAEYRKKTCFPEKIFLYICYAMCYAICIINLRSDPMASIREVASGSPAFPHDFKFFLSQRSVLEIAKIAYLCDYFCFSFLRCFFKAS